MDCHAGQQAIQLIRERAAIHSQIEALYNRIEMLKIRSLQLQDEIDLQVYMACGHERPNGMELRTWLEIKLKEETARL